MPPAAARSRARVAFAAAAALALAGCGAGDGGGGDRTDPPPPDRLAVTLDPAEGSSFRIALDCDVADRSTCAEILEAIAEERDAERCAPVTPSGRRIRVRGTIGGQEVSVAIERRTDCEARLYDRVSAALAP
jgi:hypothetical protein